MSSAAEPERPALLVERNKTHGSFEMNGKISQATKQLWRGTPGWEMLTDDQREALDVIALKVSRILSGQAKFKDHWLDMGGYSHLGLEACDR